MKTLLRFYAEWCNPCKAIEPIVDRLKEEYKDEIQFLDVNIEDNPQLRLDYSIRSIPAFVLLENRIEIGRRVGSGTYSEIKEFLDESGSL